MIDSSFEASYTVSTSAGMCGLWQPEYFAHVTDLGIWEEEVSKDTALERCIRAGVFVPLNVGGNGVFQVTVRTGERNSAERRYTLVSSTPYLLVSQGVIAIGGLESVGSYAGGAEEISFAVGRYAAVVHLIDWRADPDSVDADGNPTESALPDFVVETATERNSPVSYRASVETFDRPK